MTPRWRVARWRVARQRFSGEFSKGSPQEWHIRSIDLWQTAVYGATPSCKESLEVSHLFCSPRGNTDTMCGYYERSILGGLAPWRSWSRH